MNGDYIQIRNDPNNRPYNSVNVIEFLNRNEKHNNQKNVQFIDHLNSEIQMFINFLKPSDEEIVLRRVMVNRIKTLILNGVEQIRAEKEHIPSNDKVGTKQKNVSNLPGESVESDCEGRDTVRCFGSYAANLYLPGSDIDLSLFSEEKDALKHLQRILCSSPLIFTKSVIFLSKARVPILRFMDICHFRYDLSLNQKSGVLQTKFVKRVLKQKPYLRDMALLLKYFLRSRQLDKSNRGGLCSYAQLLMLMNFLNLHPLVQRQLPVKANLSTLFMDFFQFFGQDFCYDRARLCFFGYKAKGSDGYLSIEDPTDPDHDVGSLATNMNAIRDVFLHAFRIMAGVAKEKVGDKYVMLSLWVKISDSEINWRDNIIKLHKKVVVNGEM